MSDVHVTSAALLRTARLLMQGEVYVPDPSGAAMIIDCHGHYTTAPEAHTLWRAAQSPPSRPASRFPRTR